MQIITQYQSGILFGIGLNILMFFGFGIYKAANLDFMKMTELIDRYPVRVNYAKSVFLWFVPYMGTCYIFYQLYILQKMLNSGKTVYDYLERKLSGEYAAQKAENE